LVIADVFVCAATGRRRESALKVRASYQKNVTLCLLLAVLCGFGGPFINVGITFGTPLAESARTFGASALTAFNALWMPLMLAGVLPNLLYCLWLVKKNRTAGKFRVSGVGHWVLAFVMAVCLFGSTLLYGLATVMLGEWGPILGWPLFMSLIVIMASLLGMLSGEWRGVGVAPLRIQRTGVTILVFAVFILAATSRYLA
jgi:L-rhamnose-H+ transport protein